MREVRMALRVCCTIARDRGRVISDLSDVGFYGSSNCTVSGPHPPSGCGFFFLPDFLFFYTGQNLSWFVYLNTWKSTKKNKKRKEKTRFGACNLCRVEIRWNFPIRTFSYPLIIFLFSGIMHFHSNSKLNMSDDLIKFILSRCRARTIWTTRTKMQRFFPPSTWFPRWVSTNLNLGPVDQVRDKRWNPPIHKLSHRPKFHSKSDHLI